MPRLVVYEKFIENKAKIAWGWFWGREKFAADLHDDHFLGFIDLSEIGELYFLEAAHEVDDGVHISFPFDWKPIELTE